MKSVFYLYLFDLIGCFGSSKKTEKQVVKKESFEDVVAAQFIH